MGNYKNKRYQPCTSEEFTKFLPACRTAQERAYMTTLYYWALRCSEARMLEAQHFTWDDRYVALRLRVRLKGTHAPKPIPLRRDRPGMSDLWDLTRATPEGLLFPFSRMTAWRIIHRAINLYPHFFKMSRVTQLLQRYGIVGAQRFTGLPLRTLLYYVGEVNDRQMAEEVD